MTKYDRLYRLPLTPRERYGKAAAASVAALLDREKAERSLALGRALDLGCGRGQFTPDLARRGWEAEVDRLSGHPTSEPAPNPGSAPGVTARTRIGVRP